MVCFTYQSPLCTGTTILDISENELKQRSYSYRKASIGCKLAALFAGYHPKMMPIPADTTVARITDDGEMMNSVPVVEAIMYDVTTPPITPITPPLKVRMMASVKNWIMTVFIISPSSVILA